MSEETENNNAETDTADKTRTAQIPQNIITLRNKGLAALERGNTDIAIDTFFRCVEQCPSFAKAREDLRNTEIARFIAANKGNPAASLPHMLFGLTFGLAKGKIQGLAKKNKFIEALLECEKLFKQNPLYPELGKLFAEIAIKAELPEIGFSTLEKIREHRHDKNIVLMEMLGRLYFTAKYYKKASEYLAKIHNVKPHDVEIARLLKDSETNATLDRGWNQAAESGDYRRGLANAEQAEKLEQANKSVKTEDDADALIKDAYDKIVLEPNNVNYYLSLSSLLSGQKRFDEALGVIDKARSIIGNDGELDRRHSSFTIAKFDADIAAFTEAGDAEAAAARQTERDQFIFNDIAERVRRYPNDQVLRYDLASQYFKYDYIDEAVEQYQISQKSPTVRVQSLYHLAMCFRKKGLLDMAVSQLEQALEFLPSMNSQKMEIMYLMGEISLEENKIEDAAKYFKEIYKVDVKFREISKYIEQVYAAQRAAKAGA